MPIRKPFTGIHEISSNSGNNIPHEGGGQLPPYGEDLFQRIMDVNWVGGGNGGIWVSGDYCCYLRYAKVSPPTLKQNWSGLSSLMFGDGGGNYSSTYAKINGRPTFLMSGQGNNYGFGWGGIIALSHNGTDWITVLFLDSYSAVHDLVWDSRVNAFFGNGGNPDFGCWKSRTGYDWAYVGGEDFYNHCPLGVADGVVGYDPDTGVMITPDDINNAFGDVFNCGCVGFCNGIWMAGGGTHGRGDSATYSSIDGGKTWDIVTEGAIGMTGNYEVLCITGAPIEDFQ
jgi:hypothetical protein